MKTAFESIHHPQDQPRGLVYSKALAAPLGACTTPLMIGATAAALQGQLVWGYLVWGLPAAILCATAWTHFTMSRTPAELHLRPGQVAIRSIHDVLRDRPLTWKPLYNVRVVPEYIEISVGWDTKMCRRREWPRYERLRDAAKQAFQAHQESSPSPAS